MKLTRLYESHDVCKRSLDHYGDPAAKEAGVGKITNKDDPEEISMLVGGPKDRVKFLKNMNKKA